MTATGTYTLENCLKPLDFLHGRVVALSKEEIIDSLAAAAMISNHNPIRPYKLYYSFPKRRFGSIVLA